MKGKTYQRNAWGTGLRGCAESKQKDGAPFRTLLDEWTDARNIASHGTTEPPDHPPTNRHGAQTSHHV